MMNDVKIENFPYRILDVLNPGITEFQYLMAFRAYQDDHAAYNHRIFHTGPGFSKLVLGHQVTFYQQIQSIINRSPADPVVFVFHADIK
jgi:hypothetical protein